MAQGDEAGDGRSGSPGDAASGQALKGAAPFRIGFTAALGVALAYVLFQAVVAVQQILVLIVVALFLAIGLNPAVDALRRKVRRRGIATAMVLGGLLLVFVGFLVAAVQPIADQASDLVTRLPGYLDQLQRDNGVVKHLSQRFDLNGQLQRLSSQGSGLGLQTIGGVVGAGKAVLSAVFALFTILILTAYFLTSLDQIKSGALRLVPLSRRERVGFLLDEILKRIGGYVLGNLATSLAAGIFAFIFLTIAGVPYSIALALLAAILDLVPLVGATIAAVIVTLVAFFTSVPVGIATGVFFLAYQQFENYILVPRVMKRTVHVSPLATIIAALIGGTLLGVVGALLAIPTAATISLLTREIIFPRQEAA